MLWNGAQWHLLVNHLPVVGFFGVVLALAFALKVRSVDIKKFVLLSTVIIGLSALAPFWTGEPAEEVVENLAGVSKNLIHEHEELAEKATILAVITALTAAVALVWQRKRPENLNKSLAGVFVLSLITAGVMGAAAHEGGKIRHPEINAAAATGDQATGSATSAVGDKKDDDD